MRQIKKTGKMRKQLTSSHDFLLLIITGVFLPRKKTRRRGEAQTERIAASPKCLCSSEEEKQLASTAFFNCLLLVEGKRERVEKKDD